MKTSSHGDVFLIIDMQERLSSKLLRGLKTKVKDKRETEVVSFRRMGTTATLRNANVLSNKRTRMSGCPIENEPTHAPVAYILPSK